MIHPSPAKLLILVLLSMAPGWAQSAPEPAAVEKVVTEIRSEAKRIESINASETPGYRRLSSDLSNWEVSGLFEGSSPLYLYARLSEGGVVREETYYFRQGKLILAKLAKWWDVEDPAQAPEPEIRQDFYIQNDQTIRRVVARGSTRRAVRTVWKGDTTGFAPTLQKRSSKIAEVVESGGQDPAAMDSLAEFPLAEAPQK